MIKQTKFERILEEIANVLDKYNVPSGDALTIASHLQGSILLGIFEDMMTKKAVQK